MLSYNDINYLSTKKLKQGQGKLPTPFIELQEWFKSKYEVKPLNIVLENLGHNQKHRLNLIWETIVPGPFIALAS